MQKINCKRPSGIAPKISVVIPVYGVESYIERCVHSLMTQTMDCAEYIFIDDCTPDKSIDIINDVVAQYPNRANNVVVVHNKRNMGQAKTRRKGIMMAKGEYIIHCDPDDWVEQNWLESLYLEAKNTRADIVWSAFESIHDDGEKVYFSNYSSNNINDFLMKLSTGQKWGSLCIHLIKREIAQSNTINWPDWNYCEDLSLIFQYALMAKRVTYINEAFYKYRYNIGSISGKKDYKGIISNIDGEISALKQGLVVCKDLGFTGKHYSNLLARIYQAKGRLFIVSKSSRQFCRLWHECNDGLNFMDIWRSSLSFRAKLATSTVFLNLYPFFK